MKRLLTFIMALLLLASAEGQILRYSNYVAPVPPVTYYAEYQTVYDAFATKPLSAIATIQEALVESLDVAGYWSRMDLFYVFASHDATEALVNWASPGVFNADNVSATAWVASEGFTGDGIADYISTNWIPSTNAVNYTQNSGTMGIYIRDNTVDPNGAYTFGLYSGVNPRVTLKARYHDETSAQWAINETGGTAEVTAVATIPGSYIITRRSSTDCEFYKNGSSLETDVATSSGLPTSEIHVLKANGTTVYGTHQASIFFIMNGITDAEATAINTIIETYMDALSKGVQ